MDVDRFGAFVAQAVTGVVVGIARKEVKKAYDAKTWKARYKEICVATTAQYLNNCYTTLMDGSDPWVCETFGSLSSHSPQCLLHITMRIAQALLPVKEPPLDQKTLSDPELLQKFRDNFFERTRSKSLQLVHAPTAHACTGPDLKTMRASWNKEGPEKEPMFRLGSRPV
jgi:hypothetical protein